MLNYVIKRLLGLIPTLLIVAVLVFLFVHMLPGDPARLIAGPEADATVIELVRKQLGLDQPLYRQFWHYITNVLQGDFGTSMVSRRPVSEEIASRFMPTFWLTLASMAWAVLFGLGASFVDVLNEDYMRTARAKGVSEKWVILKHGLRNAMIPVVTMMGLQFGFLLGGSIVVEKVFNWPGLGRLLVDSVDMRDYPVIQAEVLLFSLEFILINLVVDVLYAAINPAIRYK